ncbi:unnamed protein product [Mycena citricolor]|uniref:Uncharacterized protein n=1 Tax=Mycena citricolor TaxID=2018698 RepID=A0AAD2Q154_9AGAR|nr:unnamed protein product [Mycena citricolor]
MLCLQKLGGHRVALIDPVLSQHIVPVLELSCKLDGPPPPCARGVVVAAGMGGCAGCSEGRVRLDILDAYRGCEPEQQLARPSVRDLPGFVELQYRGSGSKTWSDVIGDDMQYHD